MLFRSGLLHHKFCVFDETIVLTGTWNPTTRGSYKHDNVVLLIESPRIAQSYLHEYGLLAARKGMEVAHDDSYDQVNLSGALIDICMSQQADCETVIIRALQEANHSIDMLAFTFTSEGVGDALVRAHQRGVDVHVIFEKTRITRYSQYERLASVNITVSVDGNRHVMHEKIIIIDNQTVLLGSYNPTSSARERNDENLLLIRQDTGLATAMAEEFTRIRAESVHEDS